MYVRWYVFICNAIAIPNALIYAFNCKYMHLIGILFFKTLPANSFAFHLFFKSITHKSDLSYHLVVCLKDFSTVDSA